MGRMKGAGFVYQRGNTWYWQIKINGQKIRRKLEAQDKDAAEVEAKRKALIASVKSEEELALFAAKSRAVIKNTTSKITLNDALKKFFESSRRKKPSKKWEQVYVANWTNFAEYIKNNFPGIVDMSEVTPAIAESYASSLLEKTKSNRTYNAYICCLKATFKTLMPGSENPFEGIKKQAETPRSSNDFTEKQISDIFNAVDGEMDLSVMHRPEMSVLFRMGAYTGLRLEDCCLLRWSAVNMSKKMITWVPAKTVHSSGKPVHIPIHEELEKQLKKAQEWKDKSGYILPNIAKRYNYNSTGIQKDAQKIIHWTLWEDKKKGERPPKPTGKYGFHSFRHSFISFCANAGIPVSVVQTIVGHTSSLVTRIYTHLTTETMKQVTKALPSMSEKHELSDSERLHEIARILKKKKQMTTTEKKIFALAQNFPTS